MNDYNPYPVLLEAISESYNKSNDEILALIEKLEVEINEAYVRLRLTKIPVNSKKDLQRMNAYLNILETIINNRDVDDLYDQIEK